MLMTSMVKWIPIQHAAQTPRVWNQRIETKRTKTQYQASEKRQSRRCLKSGTNGSSRSQIMRSYRFFTPSVISAQLILLLRSSTISDIIHCRSSARISKWFEQETPENQNMCACYLSPMRLTRRFTKKSAPKQSNENKNLVYHSFPFLFS